MSHDDPESWHAHSPCSVRSESRCVVGAPRPKHKAIGCVAQPALALPSGGRDFPPAIAQRAFFLLSLVLGPTLLSLSSNSARQPTGVPQLALLLS